MSNLGPRIFQDLDRKHPIASAHDFVKSIFEQIGKCRGHMIRKGVGLIRKEWENIGLQKNN